MKAALLGETSEALLCSGERDGTRYCSSVGELIFLWASSGGGGGALLAESFVKAWMASCAWDGLERLGGGVYCGRLTWCCSGDWRVLIEGSEGLRWSEGERSDCCCCFRWAASSWLADMVEGWDGLQVLLRAHCLLAPARAACVLWSGWLLRCNSLLIRCGGCGEGKVLYGQLLDSWTIIRSTTSETRLAPCALRSSLARAALGKRHQSTTPRGHPRSLLSASHHTVRYMCITCSIQLARPTKPLISHQHSPRRLQHTHTHAAVRYPSASASASAYIASSSLLQ